MRNKLLIVLSVVFTTLFLYLIFDNKKISKKFIIDLPEEIQAVNSTDQMKAYYNKAKDTLFVEYSQQDRHICGDLSHFSCKGGGYNRFSNDDMIITTKQIGCTCQGNECYN
jgi:hypothetical protein